MRILKKFLPALVLAFSVPSFAQKREKFHFFSPKDKSLVEMEITNHQGINLSASCLKGKLIRCEAWTAVQKKASDPDRKGIGTVGNPAALYCASYKSQNIIFLDSEKKEYDYCLFGDNSAVDAWDLYNRHHP